MDPAVQVRNQGPRVPKKEIRAAMEGPRLVQRLGQLPGVGTWVRNRYRRWYRWHYLKAFNPQMTRARQLYHDSRDELSPAQQRISRELSDRGYAWATFAELWPGLDFAYYRGLLEGWLQTPDVVAQEHAYRTGASTNKKDYLVRMYGRGAAVSPDDPWLHLGVAPTILSAVNAYLGLASRVTYFDVWDNVARQHSGPDQGAQRWHRDPEDSRLVKAFLYFSDVDEGAGAMEYVPYSRQGDRYGKLWPQEFPAGSNPPANELESRIPETDRIRCVAPAGSVLLADTSGFHRGGRATTHNRWVATWTYVSPRSVWPRAFELASTPPELSPCQRFSITE